MKRIIKVFKDRGVVNSPKNTEQFFLQVQKYCRNVGIDTRDFYGYATSPLLLDIAKEADLLPEYVAAVYCEEYVSIKFLVRQAKKMAKKYNTDVNTFSQRMMAFAINYYPDIE